MKSKQKTQKRRRIKGKTDYKKRLSLLKSGAPRIVIRRTNKYFIIQYVESEEAKDKVIFGFTSKSLLNYGWPEKLKGSLKSIPAAYLSGFLAGKKIKKKNLENPIPDTGMSRIIMNSRIFAFIKGLIDSGIEIKCNEKNFPGEEKIKGKFLKNSELNFEKIKSNINK